MESPARLPATRWRCALAALAAQHSCYQRGLPIARVQSHPAHTEFSRFSGSAQLCGACSTQAAGRQQLLVAQHARLAAWHAQVSDLHSAVLPALFPAPATLGVALSIFRLAVLAAP